jgi:hypothetical protein
LTARAIGMFTASLSRAAENACENTATEFAALLRSDQFGDSS